jgi:hypothetical protein
LAKPERPKVSRSKSGAGETAGKTECLCLECGISNYLVLEGHRPDVLRPGEEEILPNTFCSACGGPLLVRGAAGAEPFYPTQ